MTRLNVQQAPYPDELEQAVKEFRYKPDWRFSLYDVERDFADPKTRKIPLAWGLTLIIFVPCVDSYHPDIYRPVDHLHPVPAATYNRASWERWIMDRVIDTEIHEACEWARFMTSIDTARRPFAATHGPGDNPYVLHEYASETQRNTSWQGELKPTVTKGPNPLPEPPEGRAQIVDSTGVILWEGEMREGETPVDPPLDLNEGSLVLRWHNRGEPKRELNVVVRHRMRVTKLVQYGARLTPSLHTTLLPESDMPNEDELGDALRRAAVAPLDESLSRPTYAGVLAWRYGDPKLGQDPMSMWHVHASCKGEVMYIDGAYVCNGCGLTGSEPAS